MDDYSKSCFPAVDAVATIKPAVALTKHTTRESDKPTHHILERITHSIFTLVTTSTFKFPDFMSTHETQIKENIFPVHSCPVKQIRKIPLLHLSFYKLQIRNFRYMRNLYTVITLLLV